jgi:elongator complex protein 6
MSSRIPPLLEPYLGLPEEASLVILTNMLGASSNWLVLRYLYSILQSGRGVDAGVDEKEVDSGVILVSFMRDLAFWKEGASRLVSFFLFLFSPFLRPYFSF